MIPFDFEYYKPSTIIEAVNIFEVLNLQGKNPLYYSGGTEIISMARRNDISTGAVIDIKGIPECNAFLVTGGCLYTGSALTLTSIEERNIFPLLKDAARKAADHTIRNKITLGGNICGRIVFREAVLPFLLCESHAVLAGREGIRKVLINDVFNRILKLNKGEFLVQLITDMSYARLPYVSIKRTKLEKIDYPLLSIDALKKDDIIRIAFSGVCPFPFRSREVEEYLNDTTIPPKLRIERAIGHLPAPIVENIEGSAEYREFVLKNTLFDIISELEGR